jgi:hypothetical protein
MNAIKKVFKDLTDTELKEMVLEIQEAEKTGVFENGSRIRVLCRVVGGITGMDVSSNLLTVQFGVLQESSFRWVNSLAD